MAKASGCNLDFLGQPVHMLLLIPKSMCAQLAQSPSLLIWGCTYFVLSYMMPKSFTYANVVIVFGNALKWYPSWFIFFLAIGGA